LRKISTFHDVAVSTTAKFPWPSGKERKGKESTTRKDGVNIGLVEAEIYP
jgi:hypothetical protein